MPPREIPQPCTLFPYTMLSGFYCHFNIYRASTVHLKLNNVPTGLQCYIREHINYETTQLNKTYCLTYVYNVMNEYKADEINCVFLNELSICILLSNWSRWNGTNIKNKYTLKVLQLSLGGFIRKHFKLELFSFL